MPNYGLSFRLIVPLLACVIFKLAWADITKEIRVLTASKGGIHLYNLSNVGFDGQPAYNKQLLNTGSELVRGVDYHWENRIIFGRTEGGTIYRTEFQDGYLHTVSEELLKVGGDDKVIAVDWVHDRLFFTIRGGSVKGVAIVSADLRGRDRKEVLVRPEPPAYIRRMSVDPYAGKIFWIYWQQAYIETCDLYGHGAEFRSMVERSFVLNELTLDIPSRKIFLVDIGSSLYSMDYSGGNFRKHWTLTQMGWLFGLDVLGEFVFWNQAESGSKYNIYKSHMNSSVVTEKLFSSKENELYSIRIVHPNIQMDPCSSETLVQRSFQCNVISTTSENPTTARPSMVTFPNEPSDPVPTTINTHSSPNILGAKQSETDSSYTSKITHHIVLFNTIISLVTIGLVLFLIFKSKKGRNQENAVVSYSRPLKDNIYESCSDGHLINIS